MRILRNWKSITTIFLVLFALVAYKSIAVESVLPAKEKHSCSTEKGCPHGEPAATTGTGGSIIWDSMADNLLSAHS